ncbi:hypothetical protein BJ973_001890 [Actinoplanes tereljensis]|uniref:Uncharacterized protein n=1 Tax=Paractinoplanes tereljensis TaxID=571912 RepID=A0A919NL67_9ACTN|nr:hypothetical protein [Actinoplanes tereljensis]GIF20203.1 hypothetical protein Ate02nite_29330 [Actinoplanes tereljensis]
MTELIGGEMIAWSDLDGTHGPAPAAGPEFGPLLATATGHTLVAGPHAADLIDALRTEQITLLVRGVPDAELLTARYAARPGVTVRCGSLEKLSGTYDTVVALDGLDRLLTTEAADLTWDETLAQLLSVLRPQGRLLLQVANLFGLHRLLALPPTPADTEWAPPDDPTRPTGPDAIRARLSAADVPVLRDYAAYPGALLGGEVLADPALRGFLEATLTAAPAPAQLADPARLIRGALRHNLADALAPAWLFVAGPGPAAPVALIAANASPATAAPSGGSTSATVAAVPPAADRPASAGSAGVGLVAGPVVAAEPASASSTRTGVAAGLLAAADRASAGSAGVGIAGARAEEVRREAGGRWVRGGGVPVPLGHTLEDLLVGAAQRRAVPVVRELLRAWQRSSAAGVPAGQVVVGADGVPHALRAGGKPVEALRRLAATLIAGGDTHLWPSPADEAELTALLAGMTGRELDPRDVPAAARAEPASIRELTIARDRLERELADARAKHEFYERQIANRDHDLKRLRQLNAVLSATVPGKAANTLVGGLKAGRRAVREVVRRSRG